MLAGHPPVQGSFFNKPETAITGSLRAEQQMNETLLKATMPAEMARQIRPPMAAELFPPRYGYERREPGITEVLHTDRNTIGDRRLDYSGSFGTYSATTRPSIDGGPAA